MSTLVWWKRLVAVPCCACVVACGCPVTAGESPDYSSIDSLASATPASAANSVQSLAGCLGAFCKTDTDKARAIFDWIVSNIDYDWPAALAGDFSQQTPEKVLRNRKGVCEGYAYLFAALADAMKLKQTTVPGVSKGLNYVIGEKEARSNHLWNSVSIDGAWKLIDCAWGAGYIDGQGRFVRRRSDHYFLTPPDQFIYNHFPDDQKWQLLGKPLTRDEYENMVLVRPEFFAYGLSTISHPQVCITSGATVKVALGAPDDVLMVADVLPTSGKSDDKIRGASTFVQRSSKELQVSASFPNAGKYILRLFARPKNDRAALCQWVADYCVTASQGASDGDPFPSAYPAFQEKNAFLGAPMKGTLTMGTTETFRLSVPGATDVGILAGAKFCRLERNGNEFQGQARILGGKISVAAKFPGKDDYSVLVEYKVAGRTASSDQ